MTTYEFWREIASGDVWAVELKDGVVVGSRGPLHWSEIHPSFLESGYEYDADEARLVDARRAEFEPLDERSVIMLAGSVE